jgi:hypothetical protein
MSQKTIIIFILAAMRTRNLKTSFTVILTAKYYCAHIKQEAMTGHVAYMEGTNIHSQF